MTNLSWEAEAAINKEMPEHVKISAIADRITDTVEHVVLVVDSLRCLLDIEGYNLKGVLQLFETLTGDMTDRLEWREIRKSTTLAWGLENDLLEEETDEYGDKSWKVVE